MSVRLVFVFGGFRNGVVFALLCVVLFVFRVLSISTQWYSIAFYVVFGMCPFVVYLEFVWWLLF